MQASLREEAGEIKINCRNDQFFRQICCCSGYSQGSVFEETEMKPTWSKKKKKVCVWNKSKLDVCNLGGHWSGEEYYQTGCFSNQRSLTAVDTTTHSEEIQKTVRASINRNSVRLVIYQENATW